jgi:Family of unknown function (DUF6677)
MDKLILFATSDDEAIEINLKDPWLAAFLAWLVPGMGHVYQGRMGKGLLFFVCIVGTFFYGLYIGDGRVVYASVPSSLTRWQYLCQIGVGLPALPALVQRERIRRGELPLISDKFMRPPRMEPASSIDASGNKVMHPDELAKWHHDLSDRFEIGTVFTVIAGLLNLLVIYDAYGGPLVIATHEEKKDAEEEKKQ